MHVTNIFIHGKDITQKRESAYMKELRKKWEENPIVEKLENDSIPGITTIEYIKELQELLAQTCIDYINKNGLTDLWGVSFSADSLDESAKWGSGNPAQIVILRLKE